MQVVLKNPNHPEYGVSAIPFPMEREENDHSIEVLSALKIGDAVKQDCCVEEVKSHYSVLKRLEGQMVNVDELDYLAKRLDSFDVGEAAQFQAMAEKLDLTDIRDFINLTFCCQQATVITDFAHLEQAGRDHYINLHGGCASLEELEWLDSEETARQLIADGEGTVTPYGVVYDNGMKLEEVYDGSHFPAYVYEENLLTVSLSSRLQPENTKDITWLYLPAAKGQIDRALLRAAIADPENMLICFEESRLPDEVDVALDFERESIYDLNDLAVAYEGYGLQCMAQEEGQFTDRGYVSYHGTVGMEELMADDSAGSCRRERGMEMGGMT